MPRQKSLAISVFNAVALGAGAVLLVVMVRRIGVGSLWAQLGGLGLWFLAFVGAHLISTTLSAIAHACFLRPHGKQIGFARLWIVQAAGESVNFLTPGGRIGEAQKVTLLEGRAPRTALVSMVLAYNVVNAFVSVAVIIVGVPVAVAGFELPVAVAQFLLASSVVALGGAALLLVLVRRGLMRTMIAALPLAEERKRKLRDLLEPIDRGVRGGQPGHAFALGFAATAASRVFYWSELYLILLALGERPSLSFMLAITAATVALATPASIVPLGLGTLEGGTYALYALLGASPELGVTTVVIRRVRSVVTSVVEIGLVTLMLGWDRLRAGSGPES